MTAWDSIIAEVTAKHRVGIKDICGDSHRRNVVKARREVCYRARTEIVVKGKPLSFPKIARRIGKHHATVILAIREYERRFGGAA